MRIFPLSGPEKQDQYPICLVGKGADVHEVEKKTGIESGATQNSGAPLFQGRWLKPISLPSG
jgi:hypothetical protein